MGGRRRPPDERGSPGGDGSSADRTPNGSRRSSPRIGRRTDPGAAGTATPSGLRSAGSSRRASPASTGRGSGARTGARSGAPEGSGQDRRERRPGGLFSGLRAPSLYPKLGETLGAAGRAVFGTPVLVLLPVLMVGVLWVAFLGIGLDHVPNFFQLVLAIPPLSSFFDLNLAATLRGQGTGILLLLVPMTVVRGVVWSVLVSLVVEALDTGRVTSLGLLRGIRCAPAVLGVVFVDLVLLFAAQILLPILGSSLGGLAFFGALIGGVNFLVFAPIVAIRDGSTARVALGTSARAARLPGPRHVGLVFLYFFVSYFAFPPTSGAFTVNPSVLAWAFVLATSVFHVLIVAAFAYRFGVVEDDVPAAAPRRRSTLFARR
jgi:hypothetical protein